MISTSSRTSTSFISAFSHSVKRLSTSSITTTTRGDGVKRFMIPTFTNVGNYCSNGFGNSSCKSNTRRWMSEGGTAEKTEEEKEAIKAAREVRK